MKTIFLPVALVLAPGIAAAQSSSCIIPQQVPMPRADLPDARQPVRRVAIGSYTLAISWSPEHCRTHGNDAGAAFQCGTDNRFGFVLHGLWPDGLGTEWPHYCRSTAILPRAVIRQNLCATPSAQLLQHEWSKHGTCMAGYTPQRYFARSTGMFRRLRFPDMDALSRRPLTAGGLSRAIADANPGIRPNMMRVTATRQGWLDEVWLCTDKSFRYARCPMHQGGLDASAPVKIWRGRAV